MNYKLKEILKKYSWKPSDLQYKAYRSDEGICRDHNQVLASACEEWGKEIVDASPAT